MWYTKQIGRLFQNPLSVDKLSELFTWWDTFFFEGLLTLFFFLNIDTGGAAW